MKQNTHFPSIINWVLTLTILAGLFCPSPVLAASADEIDQKVAAALDSLYADSSAAKELSGVAKGILVFPNVVKGGFIVGGHYGEGALLVNGSPEAYFNTVAASYGLQIGAQKFGYAMFLMTEEALNYLETSQGWEIGVGPSVVVVDSGLARSLSTSTAKEDIYAFFFSQKGLMAGLGLQGSKITRIDPEE
ncbi:MAG: lipid-binding SYLF domain-containing protein [Syntrophotaleaceae bacterium]